MYFCKYSRKKNGQLRRVRDDRHLRHQKVRQVQEKRLRNRWWSRRSHQFESWDKESYERSKLKNRWDW